MVFIDYKKYGLKPNEYALILAIAKEDTPGNTEGWLELKNIFSVKDYDGTLLFKSQKQNFPKYIKPLKERGLVERREIKKIDKYNRKTKHWGYRLKQNINTWFILLSLFRIYDSYLNFISIEKEMKSKKKYNSHLYTIDFLNTAYSKKFRISDLPNEFINVLEADSRTIDAKLTKHKILKTRRSELSK